jgi:hypothetical protein
MSFARPFLLALCLSCQPGVEAPGSYAACPDATGRAAWIRERWAGEPGAVLAVLEAGGDPHERAAVLMILAEADADVARALCERLDPNRLDEACKRILGRPHLDRGRSGSSVGRRFGGLRLEPGVPSPLADVAPRVAPACEGSANAVFRECQHALAIEASEHQDAAALCAAIPGQQWVDECLFRAAEATLERAPLEAGPEAVTLCLSAGEFAVQCSSHLARRLARFAPGLESEDADAWPAFAAGLEAMRASAAGVDEPFATSLAARLWSQSLERAVWRSTQADAGMAEALPPQARRHLATVLAARTAGLDAPPSLQDALARLQAFFEGEAALVLGPAAAPPKASPPLQVDTRDLPFETVFYLRHDQRALADEPRDDLLVCLLEAYGRAGLLRPEDLEAALDHPAAPVRWTAARHIPAGGAYDGPRGLAAADEEPAVRALVGPDR